MLVILPINGQLIIIIMYIREKTLNFVNDHKRGLHLNYPDKIIQHQVQFHWKDNELIRRLYLLNVLSDKELAETSNIIASIQTIRYLLEGLLPQESLPNEIASTLAKDCITLCYAVIEAIFIAASYKIQSACNRCRIQGCPFRSNSVYGANDSFEANKNAPMFMQRTRIINPFHPDLKKLRNQRHDVHIIKQGSNISQQRQTMIAQANQAHQQLENTLIMMGNNMTSFIQKAGCPIPIEKHS
jgi:hypothetical protein